MIDKFNIQNAELTYSVLLRDGGSAVILLVIDGRAVKLRSMRSIMEQKSINYKKIEVSINSQFYSIYESPDCIPGFSQMFTRVGSQIDEKVLKAFLE